MGGNKMKIKFRAWDETVNKMIFFDKTIFNKIPFTEKSKFPQYESCPEYHDLLLMQYIDEKDKHGEFYCQDDIVKYKNKNYRVMKGTYTFFLAKFYEACQDDPHDFFSENAYKQGEIIGNIYQNPELLKE